MTNPSQPKILNNRFQLDRKLGQGGMATVYLGRDLRLGRPVAVKVLHGQYASDDQFLKRFKHEADAAAQLGHPNIVRVYDVGSDQDLHYIVMEYINGSDLKEIITQEGPLAVNRTLKIVQQIAEALEAAHRSGLVHRDVKPQNVLIDADDQVHLSDFGIAKSDRSSAYTDPGTTFGTADYLAPEQAQGLGATPRSDVYALGVVTYEMLTGRLPFTGDTPLNVAMQHVQATPPPLRQFNPTIPPQLEAIVLQAMSKDPSQRPASARMFAEQLRTYRERGNQATVAAPAVAAPVVRPAPRPDQTVAMDPQRARPVGPQGRAVAPPRQPVPPPMYQQPAYQQPAYQPEPARRSGGGCTVFVLGLLLLAGLSGLAYAVFFTDLVPMLETALNGPQNQVQPTEADVPPPTAEPTATVELVTVPNLVGMKEKDALDLLESIGLAEQREEPRNDPAPRTTVIEQLTPPNSQVPRGEVIRFRLSLGPAAAPPVALPEVTGQPFEAAAAQLRAAGLNVSRTNVANPADPETVLAQDPPPGTEVQAGSQVQLTVSLGDLVEFPAVIGLTRSEALEILTGNTDLRLDVIDEQGPDRLPNFENIRPDQVVSATANGTPVLNGELVPRGSVIVLGVRRP